MPFISSSPHITHETSTHYERKPRRHELVERGELDMLPRMRQCVRNAHEVLHIREEIHDRAHGQALISSPPRAAAATASRSTLSSTEAGTPPGALQDDHDVWEVAPPTPGAHVTRDPEHPYMPTPVRANHVTTTTPADSAKKSGDNAGHPINLP